MKKILLVLFLLFCGYVTIALYFLDKEYYLSPIAYSWDMVIRSDDMGDGYFGANRTGGRLHNGIDLYAEVGTPVLASRSGRVTTAMEKKGIGKYVVIAHPGNMVTLYGHLSEISVSVGQWVRQGEVIGKVGKTGNANYTEMLPHLHFEIRNNDIPSDPSRYLR